MKRLTLQRLGIGLFCGTLIGGGMLTIGTGAKAITKEMISGIKSGYTSNGLIGLVEGGISSIESGVSSNLFGEESFINLYGLVERGLGRHYIRDTNIAQSVIKDNNGQLQFITNPVDTVPYIEQISKVNAVLKEKGVPLVYIQTPLKVIDGYTQMPDSIIDYATSNTDAFVEGLQAEGVDVLDLRTAAEEDQLDKSTQFYNTDHHWRTETAFWGVGKTVEYLSKNYGIDLDPEGIYTNKDSYNITTYTQSFLGSQGRRVGKYYGGVDDYNLMLPNYDTEYAVTINKSDSSTTKEGNFEETIIKKSLLEEESVFTNRYASYFGADFPEVVIENRKSNNDLKVLILKDSFALPFSAFFSTMVGETRMVDLRYYTGEIEDYIEAYNPDLVLYVYKSINTQK